MTISQNDWQNLKKAFPFLDAEVWADLEVMATSQEYAAGDVFLRAGELAVNVFWLFSGACREYFITLDGKEFNKSFSLSGQVTGSLYDLNLGDASTVTIEFIKPSRGLLLSYSDLVLLRKKHQSFNQLYYGLLEAIFIKKSRREYELLALNASERYERFKELYPGGDQYIPLYHIASYLGITPEAFSRIRKNSP